MESQYCRRGRSGSRTFSTSSSPEVRCGCQYYRSDSLLPERSALTSSKPVSRYTAIRMVQTPPTDWKQLVECGDHDYEPIGTSPALRMNMITPQPTTMSPSRLSAPVVKITDTDMVPVGDSDDSIEDFYRLKERTQMLEGDVVLPLDGCIEDHAMQSCNLGDETVDASTDEFDNSPEHLQDVPIDVSPKSSSLINEIKTNLEIKNNQVELVKPEAGQGFQEKFKNQAGKIRSRLRSIHKSDFTMNRAPEKSATEKNITVITNEIPPSPRPIQKASRMERFRMALPERPRFSLPDKTTFHLLNKSKFHLPESSKFKFSDKSKFHIKKLNIQLPKSLNRPRRNMFERVPRKPYAETNPINSNSTTMKRRIFDFSTYPHPKLFERKSKTKVKYVTSSPKDFRPQPTESSTFPRSKKSTLSQRWAQRFGDTSKTFHDSTSIVDENIIDRSKPWMHPSFEKPRLSLKPQTSKDDGDEDEFKVEEEEENNLPWENSEKRTYNEEEETTLEDEDDRSISYVDKIEIQENDLVFNQDPLKDPKIIDEQLMNHIRHKEPMNRVKLFEDDNILISNHNMKNEEKQEHVEGLLEGGFPPVDPRLFDYNLFNFELSENEDQLSIRSDRENQQSSGSSCERRRHGVIEEIDSDEFFLREKGISKENMRFRLANDLRNALRPQNALIDEILLPPQRPKRGKYFSQRQPKKFIDSFEEISQFEGSKRSQDSLVLSEKSFDNQHNFKQINQPKHQIVYQTESPSTSNNIELDNELFDKIIVLKPERRKSKRSKSHNILTNEHHCPMIVSVVEKKQPLVPGRIKRLKRENSCSLSLITVDGALCNGYSNMHSCDLFHQRIIQTPPATFPSIFDKEIESKEIDDIMSCTPIPPKRTRSFCTNVSLPQEDDRTSHGAESLPIDFGYLDEEIPTILRDSSSREPSLSGYPCYAVIEKKDKPLSPPPPRKKRQQKYATTPRPSKITPKRPQRAYSTLRLVKSDSIKKSSESMPLINHEYSLEQEDDFHKDLLSGKVLVKMLGRPLPPPPRPPRHRLVRKGLLREVTSNFSETVASTQTDPLPDDLIIEDEITAAKLVVTPSRSGSAKVFISTERLNNPIIKSCCSTRSATPIPTAQIQPLWNRMQQRDVQEIQPINMETEKKKSSFNELGRLDPNELDVLRSALFSTEEPLRIPSLEVSDLKVDRLTASQLEAYKIEASEIDAKAISATEMTNIDQTKDGIHPSLIQELISIKNQLDAVKRSQLHSHLHSVTEDASMGTSNERIDFDTSEPSKETNRTSSFTRVSSPMLNVQALFNEQESTIKMDDTLTPASTSANLTSKDSIENTTTTIVLAETIEQPTTAIIKVTGEDMNSALNKQTITEAAETLDDTRSRSSSQSRSHLCAVRQTASPVKSLPPVISVTPDNIITTQDNSMPLKQITSNEVQSQRAVISYCSNKQMLPSKPLYHAKPCEINQSSPSVPMESFPSSPVIKESFTLETGDKFVTFQTSKIPPEFFRLVNPPVLSSTMTAVSQQHYVTEPGITEIIGQLLRALIFSGTRSLRHFVNSIASRFESQPEEAGGEKVRRIELAMCALLIFIAVLIIVCICTPRSVMHHHHWDYFNPPQ